MRISDWSSDVCSSDLLLFLYLGLYACILLFGNSTPLLFLCYIFLGFSMIMLFINAFHDAAHGSVFKKRKHNQRFMYVLELFGSNSWLWAKRHNALHHPYPNIQPWDTDIKQSDVVRIFPDGEYLSQKSEERRVGKE